MGSVTQFRIHVLYSGTIETSMDWSWCLSIYCVCLTFFLVACDQFLRVQFIQMVLDFVLVLFFGILPENGVKGSLLWRRQLLLRLINAWQHINFISFKRILCKNWVTPVIGFVGCQSSIELVEFGGVQSQVQDLLLQILQLRFCVGYILSKYEYYLQQILLLHDAGPSHLLYLEVQLLDFLFLLINEEDFVS